MSSLPSQAVARSDEANRVRALALPAPEAVSLPNGSTVFVRSLSVLEHLECQDLGLDDMRTGVRLAGLALSHPDGSALFSADEAFDVVSGWPESWLNLIVTASQRLAGARDGLDVVEVARRD